MKAGALLRVSGLGVLVFGATWLVAVAWWRASGTEVTSGHLLACLLVLPLLLFAALLGLRALLRRRRARRDAAGTEGGGQESPGVPPAPSDRPLFLHAAAAWTRAGRDPDTIARALAEPSRPPLHPRLRDSMGLPVFAAGVEDLDPAWSAAWLGRNLGEHQAAALPAHVLRALALLEPVAEDLFVAALGLEGEPQGSAAPVPTAGAGLHPHAMHHSRSARAPDGAAPRPPLRVQLLLPAAWPGPVREATATRMTELAAASGLTADRFTLEARAATGPDEAWRALDRAATLEAGVPHLLLATESMLDPQRVERLESGDQLLVSGHLEGRIPGEAAAGLLLVAAPVPGTGAGRPVRLHRSGRAPAGRGRAAAAGSARLLQDAVAIAGLESEAAAVFTDADHRPSRAVEAAGAIHAVLPDVEPADAARHLGLACGDAGLAAPLVLVAAAAAQVREAGAAALLLGLAGETERIALAVSPLPVPNPDPDPDPDPEPADPPRSAAATPAATDAATA